MHFAGILSIDGYMFGTPQNQKCILFSTTNRVSETTQKQNNSSYPELSGDMRFVGVLTDSSRTPCTPFYGGLYQLVCLLVGSICISTHSFDDLIVSAYVVPGDFFIFALP